VLIIKSSRGIAAQQPTTYRCPPIHQSYGLQRHYEWPMVSTIGMQLNREAQNDHGNIVSRLQQKQSPDELITVNLLISLYIGKIEIHTLFQFYRVQLCLKIFFFWNNNSYYRSGTRLSKYNSSYTSVEC
jgi:hypothetical protein